PTLGAGFRVCPQAGRGRRLSYVSRPPLYPSHFCQPRGDFLPSDKTPGRSPHNHCPPLPVEGLHLLSCWRDNTVVLLTDLYDSVREGGFLCRANARAGRYESGATWSNQPIPICPASTPVKSRPVPNVMPSISGAIGFSTPTRISGKPCSRPRAWCCARPARRSATATPKEKLPCTRALSSPRTATKFCA